MSSRPDLRLDWCSYAAANYAAEHWHYSKRMPSQQTVNIGVWEDGTFIGAVVFGRGANNNMGKPYGLAEHEVAELVRVALRQHRSPVSRIVGVALRLAVRVCPKLRLILSYADPEQGHIGGIYQAGNWLYLGMTASADEYIVNGRRMHGRALRSTRVSGPHRNVPAQNIMHWAQQVLDPKIRRVAGSQKHRYLMPLDAAMRAQLAALAQPYPKRPCATSILADAPAVQAGDGGSTPTVALPAPRRVEAGA